MKVRVLHWWTNKLWLLNHGYKGRPQLEIVDLNSRSSDAWRYSLNSRSNEISERPSLAFSSCVHLCRFFLSITPPLKPLLLSPYAESPFNLWIGFICKWTSHRREDQPVNTQPTLPKQSKMEKNKKQTKTPSHFHKIDLISWSSATASKLDCPQDYGCFSRD